MNISDGDKKKIAEAITDLELSIEHVKSVPLMAKAKRAEDLADSSLVVIKLFAKALGVDFGN